MPLFSRHFVTLLCAGAILTSAACKQYAFTINDQEIYTPPPLFSDFQIADQNLRECVKQTIVDNNIHSADQLTQLGCSSAGIESIGGLDQFPKMKQVDLRNNHLVDLSPLLHCKELVEVFLDQSSGSDCATITTLRSRGVEIGATLCR